MKKLFVLIAVTLWSYTAFPQTNTFPASGSVGIGTANPKSCAKVEITSTSKGILFPRMTLAQRNAIVSPVAGLLIYQTDNSQGFYYYNGTGWVAQKQVNGQSNNIFIGKNAGKLNSTAKGNIALGWDALKNNTSSDDLIAIGDSALMFSTGTYNIGIGKRALYSNTTGSINTAIGYGALMSNTVGSVNTAVGLGSMALNDSGYYNAAFGFSALSSNTNGGYNTSIGAGSMESNTTGSNNVALGTSSLQSNTSGNLNTSIGYSSLSSNDIGFENVAVGSNAMLDNTSGNYNVAVGYAILPNNTTGSSNTSIGRASMYNNISGSYNTSLGFETLFSNSIGLGNVAIGYEALYYQTNKNYNTAIGYSAGTANEPVSYATFIGYDADKTVNQIVYSYSTAVGAQSRITSGSQVRIGSSSTVSIGGYANWSNISDGRFKRNIKENVPGLEFINKLKPVTYNLDVRGINAKTQVEEDASNTVQIAEKEKIIYSGFIAQDVEKTAKEIGYDFSGVDAAKNENDLYGLRYAEFVVPLVKSVQELSEQNLILKTELQNMKNEIAQMKMDYKSSHQILPDDKTQLIYLGNNEPNPFISNTTINYHIDNSCKNASIRIQNASTNALLNDIKLSAAQSSITIDASSFASGTYTYSLIVDGKVNR